MVNEAARLYYVNGVSSISCYFKVFEDLIEASTSVEPIKEDLILVLTFRYQSSLQMRQDFFLLSLSGVLVEDDDNLEFRLELLNELAKPGSHCECLSIACERSIFLFKYPDHTFVPYYEQGQVDFFILPIKKVPLRGRVEASLCHWIN